jgi:DNA repair exonuclease SbcCD ATPase subunit
MYDGAPDGAVLLGLDRRSFYAVACVRQADVLGIKEAAEGLQVHLQRAAATAMASSTAAEALRILDTYRREDIGTEQAPTKPLVKARNRLREAEEQLRLAERAQTDLEALRLEVETKRNEADLADKHARIAEAKRASVEALALRQRLDTAERLAPLFPEGEPRHLSDDASAADAVATALEAWEQRPRDPFLSGEGTGTLEQALAGVPDPGEGDLEEDAAVRTAAEAHRRAEALLQGHRSARPAAQEQTIAPSPAPKRTAFLLSGLAGCFAGVVVLLAGLVAIGVVVGLAGAGVAAYAYLSGKRVTLPSGRDAWRETEEELQRSMEVAESALRAALEARGSTVATGGIGAAYERYRDDCERRRRRLELRRRLEEVRRYQEAEASLRRAAAGIGLDGSARPAELVERLRSWQEQRSQRLEELDANRRSWTDLKEALAGLTIEELRAATLKRGREAEALGAAFSPEELEALQLEEDVQGQVQSLLTSAQAAHEELARLEQRLSDQEARFPDLAAASEERELAEEDLARLQDLDRVLARTRDFLAQAAERAHSNIAPALQATLERWLSHITSGRYAEARVDPQDLRVRVRTPDGQWREADRLSHGTAEQVYLLLRVALAERLGNRDEPCPLILDDVTAHSDPQRTNAILDALAAISAERQVIFFSQEGEILEWARANQDKCKLAELPVLEPAR